MKWILAIITVLFLSGCDIEIGRVYSFYDNASGDTENIRLKLVDQKLVILKTIIPKGSEKSNSTIIEFPFCTIYDASNWVCSAYPRDITNWKIQSTYWMIGKELNYQYALQEKQVYSSSIRLSY